MNPIEILKSVQNPKQFIAGIMKQNQNPMIGQLVQMARSGNSQQLEIFAKNICKERGMDFDKEFANFMKQIKG